MSSFLEPAEAAWGRIIGRTPVEITTLDEYCLTNGIEHIDLLKSDTQGFELEVLTGAESLTSARRIHLIYLEVIFSEMYEAIPSFDVLYRFLLDRGFELVSFYNSAFRSQRLSWCDCLFANRDARSTSTS